MIAEKSSTNYAVFQVVSRLKSNEGIVMRKYQWLAGAISLLLITTGGEVVYAAMEKEVMVENSLHSKVLETIHHSQEIPGLQAEEFSTLRDDVARIWSILVQEKVIEITGRDKDLRPYFVSLQGIIEHVLATELQKEIKTLKGVIHTPMPATPLCMRGEISKELVDPSIEMDPARLFTVKARGSIVRDYLFKGGDLYIVYPKEGLDRRTKEQQTIYKQELLNFPCHLVDMPLDCETIPIDLIGATYLFQDQQGRTFVFAIKMTQAKDPEAMGSFGLWFGPIETPAIHHRVQAVSTYLEQYGSKVLKY